MKKVFKAALIAIFMLLAISIAVNAQSNTTNVTSGPAYGNITANANNVTSPTHAAPGFGGFFAVIGLASAAYLVMGRRR